MDWEAVEIGLSPQQSGFLLVGSEADYKGGCPNVTGQQMAHGTISVLGGVKLQICRLDFVIFCLYSAAIRGRLRDLSPFPSLTGKMQKPR